jgi:hypothetical protein
MLSTITGLTRSTNLLWALGACACLLMAGCDKLPLLAPQESTITLSTASTVVQANGVTELRATVLEQGGTPVQNGTTVTFSTTLGTLSPTDARTTNGVATVQFLGNGQSGTASVRAISGGAASEPLEISVGAAATSRVTLTASPSSVPSSGGSTTLSALVADQSGNPLSGVPVSFTTTAGTLSAAVVNTDSTGIAKTTLTTNVQANVTATAGATASTPLTVAVAVRPTVSIALASGSTPIEGATATLSITANAGTGGSPIQNVAINYGDGSSDELGSITGTVAVQHVYRDDGSFTPSVTATDTSGNTATASTVIVVQPFLVTITASQSSTTNTVTLTANTPAGLSISSYAWTFGDGSSSTTTSNPVQHTYALDGTYNVRVTARSTTNETRQGSTTITVE